MVIDSFDYNKDISLVQRVYLILHKMIRENTYPSGSQLPNEIELAKLFKASRSTVRSALQMLEQSGIVIKRRGVGTFVSKDPILVNNLSMNFGITQVIESIGAVPGTIYCKVYEAPIIDKGIATRLEIPENSDVLIIERVRTADGKKVAFTQDIFELSKFYNLTNTDSYDELVEYLEQDQSLYRYLQSCLDKPIHHAISHILPVGSAGTKVTGLLGVPENSVLLQIEQVDYTTCGEPIWLAREYHIADMFTFSVYRMM